MNDREPHSYLFRTLGESVRADMPELHGWGFGRDAYHSLLMQIGRLSTHDALRVCAWYDCHKDDDDIPAALQIDYAVAHLARLPQVPVGYSVLEPQVPIEPVAVGEPDPIPAVEPRLEGISRTISAVLPSIRLYHFTDISNVNSIRSLGLLSWSRLDARGIPYKPASTSLSRDLDARRNLSDYVHLALRPQHPMAWRAIYERRVRSLVWLQIDRAVARWSATRFSDKNATALDAIVNSDWRTAFESLDPQAEVLVRGRLHPRWITFPSTVHVGVNP